MSTVLLSCIIPAFNAERTIARTLGALLTEPLSSEIIIINDGSWDRTHLIVEMFCKISINLKVITQQNAGPGVSRNIGIREATGKYVTFCDADDIAIPVNQLKLATIANENDAEVACGTGFSMHNYQMITPFHDDHITQLIASDQTNVDEKNALKFLLEPTSCTKIFLKSFLIENQIQFSHGQFEDVLFTYKALMKASRIVVNPFPLFIYDMYGTASRSNEVSMTRFDIFTSLSEILPMLVHGNLPMLEVSALAISLMKLTLWCFENVPKEGVEKFKVLMFDHFVLLRARIDGSSWRNVQKFITSPLDERAFLILNGFLYSKWSRDEFNVQLDFIRIGTH